jgi:hypothetical protein
MRKSFLTVLLLIAVLVTGCQANNTASNNATQEQVQAFSSATPEEIAAVTPASPALEQSPVPTTPPGCTVISPKPTPGPTEQSVFPPVDDADWQFGPRDAEITFVEYGDFQ